MSGSPRGEEIDRLIHLLAKLPGLGPRSARRAALALLKKRETLLEPLADAMSEFISAHSIDDLAFSIDEQCALHVGACRNDGIMDTHSPQNLQGCPAYVDLIPPP